jgi:hypothetical protein
MGVIRVLRLRLAALRHLLLHHLLCEQAIIARCAFFTHRPLAWPYTTL